MANGEPTPGARYHPLLQLLRTAESVWHASRIFFQQWNLSPSQFNILNLLRGSKEGLTQSELSRELITHRSNITGLIDRLEKRKLVQRKTSLEDRRVWRVSLSPKGVELFLEILPDYFRLVEELWGETPTTKAAQLGKQLESLAAQAARIASELDRIPKKL